MAIQVSKDFPVVVMLLTDDDGEDQFHKEWHYIFGIDASRTLCTGEAFGEGESRAEYKTKKGKITCERCREIIKEMKQIRL